MGAVALREEFFHSSRYASQPFDCQDDLETIRQPSDHLEKLGLESGSVLRSINGQPYTGWLQLLKTVRRAKPGDLMQVEVRTQRDWKSNSRSRSSRCKDRAFPSVDSSRFCCRF